ncbi:non-ribosomal peptide synthetase [Nocardia paucivorans]|uniref:non-ribosomal peptide synthetase n=1 Tax=Nocardia paucivorans TaxID=114259 RepID=UPI000594B506|nr:non-ribosomal peptide synthetase [Nocardia paucivorans]
MQSAQRPGAESEPIGKEEIRAAVARQLGLAPTDISDTDDLIQLGLDSIRTMKLAGGWRKKGFDVNFAQLAATPTVAAWFEALAGSVAAEPEPERSRPGSDREAVTADGAVETTDAEPDDEYAPFPLATMQHAYWIGRSDEQELGGVAAHLYVEFDGGRIDPLRLEQAVDRLVAAHPMLRTRFLPDGTQQTLPAPGRPVFRVVDLRDHSDADAEAELTRLRDEKTHQRLAVEDGQVIDITLTLRDAERTRLHVDVDMLAGDAMSYRVLISDLAALYHGAVLPEPGYSYRRYRLEHTVDPRAHARDRQWWQQRLPELPGAPELPTVSVGERGAAQRTVRYDHWLAPEAKQRLLAAAHERGITPATALAAVFAETIGGWSAQSKFLLNVPLFHREPVHPDIDRVIGDFTSSIMLEVDLTENLTVAERARALQRTMHESGAHTAYSGLEVLRDLGRYRGEPVLAPIVYTSALNLGELFADQVTDTFGEPVWIISQGPQVLLDAQVTEVRGGLLLNWDVRASAFPAGLVEAMFERYTAAVERLGESEAGWNAESAARLPAAQAAVRAAVDATDGPVSGRRLHQGFFEHAATHPDAPAMVWGLDSEQGQRTYGSLAAEALAIAGALHAAGVRVGDAVAVQLPKGPDQIPAVLGVLAAGATYVPIGFDQPVRRRAEILRTAEVSAALTITGADMGAAFPCLPIDEARTHEPLAAPVYPDAEAIAYILFTSGSTGVPKGVDVSHGAAMNTIDALNDHFAVGPADRTLALSALEFDLSVYDIFGMLSVGGAVVAVGAEERAEATTWVRLLRTHRATVLNCVPGLLDMILQIGGDDLGSLRAVLLGGDWVGADLARRLARQAPGCRFAGLGGATEAAIHSTICEVEGDPPSEWATIPFGVPLRNVRCRVVSPAGRDCPDWVPGELWIGGAGVAAGYHNDPERTAQRFVEYDGLRWYRTGDMARYWPDGTIEFLGRADHQVQIRGYRVELGEVESALRTVPGVRHAVAAVIGDRSPVLAAAVAGDPQGLGDITAALAELLPAYMIPTTVRYLEQMPLTPNGKLDRRAVVGLLGSGAPDTRDDAPRDELEAALVDIVGSVLDIDTVGVYDDFFALGGDSVLATAVVAQVREWLDVDHALVADLFATRTVAGFAARLNAREAERGTPGRLLAVAKLYLEVAGMSDEEIMTQT